MSTSLESVKEKPECLEQERDSLVSGKNLEDQCAGAVSVALSKLEEWLPQNTQAADPGSMPGWVDALLLILDQAMKVQPPRKPAGDPKVCLILSPAPPSSYGRYHLFGHAQSASCPNTNAFQFCLHPAFILHAKARFRRSRHFAVSIRAKVRP